MPDVDTAERWAGYLVEYHDANPGITEEVLGRAYDDGGRTAYDWLVDAVPAEASTVVDLACGSAPLARPLARRRVIGVDQSAGELAKGRSAGGLLVQGRAFSVPLAGGCADAVVVSMALMLLHPLEAVLGEVARLLRPGGAFAATIPVRTASPGFSEVIGALGQGGVGYPEPLDAAPERFASAGFTLARDETATFRRTVDGPDEAARVVRGFSAPGASPERVAEAVERLRRAVPLTISYRVRRLVARR
jgi:SAM-dependent methyltransferase